MIDTSTDLRQQAIRFGVDRIDAIFFTHPHADHVAGIDEVRSFNMKQGDSIPAYANQWTESELKKRFSYIFSPGKVEGGGIPQITLTRILKTTKSIKFNGVEVIPVRVKHGSKWVLGYRFDSIAYVTDCSYIPSESLSLLRELDVLVLDCLRLAPHRTHLNLEKALEVINVLTPRRTILTHLGHDFDYQTWKRKLPKNVELAFDGMVINANRKRKALK